MKGKVSTPIASFQLGSIGPESSMEYCVGPSLGTEIGIGSVSIGIEVRAQYCLGYDTRTGPIVDINVEAGGHAKAFGAGAKLGTGFNMNLLDGKVGPIVDKQVILVSGKFLGIGGRLTVESESPELLGVKVEIYGPPSPINLPGPRSPTALIDEPVSAVASTPSEDGLDDVDFTEEPIDAQVQEWDVTLEADQIEVNQSDLESDQTRSSIAISDSPEITGPASDLTAPQTSGSDDKRDDSAAREVVSKSCPEIVAESASLEAATASGGIELGETPDAGSDAGDSRGGGEAPDHGGESLIHEYDAPLFDHDYEYEHAAADHNADSGYDGDGGDYDAGGDYSDSSGAF